MPHKHEEHNESIRKSPGIGITFVEAKLSLSNNTFSAVPRITFRFRLSEALESGQNITISLRGFGGSSFDSFTYVDIKKVFCGKSRWTSEWNPVSEKLTFWIHHGSILQTNKLCQLTFSPSTQNTWRVPSFENITVRVDTRSAVQRVNILTHFGFSLSFRSPLNIIPGIVGSVGNASINFVTENNLPVLSLLGISLESFSVEKGELHLSCDGVSKSFYSFQSHENGTLLCQLNEALVKGSNCVLTAVDVIPTMQIPKNKDGIYKLVVRSCLEDCNSAPGKFRNVSLAITKSSAVMFSNFHHRNEAI